MLSYWLYVSEALSPPRSVEDVLLYFQSRNRNPPRAITGYLHRSSTHYAQYIEGSDDMVAILKRRIVDDPRHTAIRTLDEGPIAVRRFAGWDMAFSYREITAFEDFQHLRGRSEALATVTAEDLLDFILTVASPGEVEHHGATVQTGQWHSLSATGQAAPASCLRSARDPEPLSLSAREAVAALSKEIF